MSHSRTTGQAIVAWVVIFVVMGGVLLSASSYAPEERELRAGLRSSSYGISPFPGPNWWGAATSSMASRFEGDAQPAVVWIVGTVARKGYCWLTFPAPEGVEKPDKVLFMPADRNEAYLDLFDEQGVEVWLQVEPGNADVLALIDLVLGRYAAHPSVVGFGVDLEWYQNLEHQEGKAVTDEEARAWIERIRSFNPDYQLFLKHWLTEKMPPTERDGLMFLDDSQYFHSLDEMAAEFEEWGQAFAPAPVGFQYGYPGDRKWWGKLADPPGDIGRALVEQIPNATDLFWVDFTAYEIWPQGE